MRVALKDVGFHGGPSYAVVTEDGPGARFDYFLHATTVDGKDWVHHHPYRRSAQAERKVGFVLAAGSIDPAHWVEAEPQMSLEERFAAYAQNEAEVRLGFRSEADMYHGID